MLTIVGTTPVLLFEKNEKRKRISMQVQSTNVDANNTGKTFIGYGHQPVATVGHPSQGEILMQSDAIDQPGASGILDKKYKGQVWAVSDTASQSVSIDEEIEQE